MQIDSEARLQASMQPIMNGPFADCNGKLRLDLERVTSTKSEEQQMMT